MNDDGWQIVSLSEIAENVSERVKSVKDSGYDKWVGLKYIDHGSVSLSRWGDISEAASSGKIFKSADVLMARRFARSKSSEQERRAAVANFEGVCSGDAYVLREKPSIEKGLLKYILNTSRFWNYVMRNADGSMSVRVKWQALAKYQVKIPPIEKQKAIVDFLDSISEVISSYQPIGAEIKYFRKALLFDIMDKIEKYSKVSDLGDLKLGRMKSKKYTKGVNPKPYLRVGNIGVEYGLNLSRIEYMDFTEKELDIYRLISGDVLVTDGDLVSIWAAGRAAIFQGEIEDCCFQNHLIRLRTNSTTLPEYAVLALEYARHKGEIAKMVHMTTIATLSVGRLADVKIPMTDLSHQKSIADKFRKIDVIIENLEHTLNSYTNLQRVAIDSMLEGEDL